VAAGPVFGNSTVIESGVRPGEEVITDGQLGVVPGARVTVTHHHP
jgi:multidrug efflux pump subunit AcrA (membrane-fusion protein)